MRTQLGTPELNEVTGKWNIAFESFKGAPGQEYMCNRVQTAFIYDSEDQAYEYGQRALDWLEANGAFPNLCEK